MKDMLLISRKARLLFASAFVMLCFTFCISHSNAESFEVVGPANADPGEYVEATLTFTGEDVVAVGVIFSFDSIIESVEYENVSPWATIMSGSSDTKVGVGDYTGYATQKWTYIINGTDDILKFKIKISDEASFGDVATLSMDTVYYATTSNSIQEIVDKTIPVAEGTSLSIKINNPNPKVYSDSTLSKPSITNVSSKSATSNYVTWSGINDASGYRVYRKTAGSAWKKVFETYDGSVLNYNDTTCESGVTYTYTVRALKQDNEGNYGLSGYNAGMSSLTMPKIYSINTTSQTKNVVKWYKVSGATSYKVYRKTSGGKWTYIGSSTNNSYTDDNATASKVYYYTVRAVRVNKKVTAYSWYNSGKYSLKNPSFTVTATATNKNTVKWSKVSGATSYIIYRKTSDGKFKSIGTTKSLSYVDKTAVSGTKYYYAVRAVRTYSLNSKTYKEYSYFNTKTITTK